MIASIVQTATRRPVTMLMLALAVVAFGIVGFSRLSLNLLPDISYPSITVQVDYPNAAPGEVENLITKPVEEVVGVLRGLKEMTSVSRAGISEVTLEFNWGADMDTLSMDVREKLDRLVLPEEAEKPVVLRFDPAMDPILRIAVSGNDNLTMLRYIAEEKLKDELEKLEGVAAAQVKGGEEEEIQVNLEQGKLAAMGITPEDLSRALSASNINRPGGSLKSTESNYLVRTLNEYDTVAEIGEITITPAGRPPVRLADVAQVSRGNKDREEITRVGKNECVIIEIFKEGDANTVKVADEIHAALKDMPKLLAPGMTLNVLFDQSRFIRGAIDEVRDALIQGGLLAILVLFLFLRDTRSTLIIATSIPISVVATFVLMYLLDVSLNIMSLGGLTLGIGMLVDCSIVVLEAIARKREEGHSRVRAAVEGTVEVGAAVMASVLTTVAVFFPIVFVEGIAGQLFRDQSLTVTFSLMASLIVSLTLIPMLYSIGRNRSGKIASLVDDGQRVPLGWLGKLYLRLLDSALNFKYLTLVAALVIFGLSMMLVPKLRQELIPALTEGEFYFEVSLPEGTSLPTTDATLASMESIALADPDVEAVYSTIGSRTVSGGMSLKNKDENLGQLNIVLKNRADEALEHRVANRLRAAYDKIPNLEAKLGRASFFSLKTPVELLFYCEDLELLKNYSLTLKPKIAEIPGIVDVRASLESGNPELNVVFDRDLLAKQGLSIGQVSSTLHDRVNGKVVSQFKELDRLIDIRLRNQEVDRDSVSDIENIVVASVNGQPITLKAVASLEPARGPSEIHRIRQSRVAIISADVSGRALSAVMADIESAIAASAKPASIEYAPGGQNKEMGESFDSMIFMLVLAIFLVYLVMAATFENLVHPILILATIPLAGVGVVLGLYLGGFAISVIALIGVILLAGIVVNNAIVLVDAINRHRRQGMDLLLAVRLACSLRLRPILMTTLTTVLGLLPMALGLGEGAELRQPLAITVSCGLVLSTLLTLVVIPALYLVVPTRIRTEAEERALEEDIATAQALENAQLEDAREVLT